MVKIARMVNMLYNRSTRKDDIRVITFCLSMEILQEKPTFLLFGCAKLNPEEILTVIMNNIILQFVPRKF